MPPITDIVMAFFALQCLWAGWKRGLLHASLGPLSFIIFLVAGIVYFDLTQNLIVSILITIIGTVIMSLIATVIFVLGRTTVDKKYRGYVFWLSRILGGLITLLWQGSIGVCIVLFLTLIPQAIANIGGIQKDIERSRTYSLINKHIVEKDARIRNLLTSLSIFRNHEEIFEYADTKEFQDFFLNQKILDLFADQEFLYQIQNKNYSEFMRNEKIQDIVNDAELMKKFTALSKRIYAEKTKKAQE